jgi:hypothetical protein
LLSRHLVTRVANEATLNSAMETTMNQLGSTPINSGCPQPLNSVNLNGRWAVPTYTSCWPTFREKVYPPIAQSSSSFTVDGSHSRVPRAGQDLYLLGNSNGNVYQFAFGSQNPIAFPQLPGSVSGPPVAIPDMLGIPADIVNLVPLSVQSNQPTGCESGACVASLAQDAGYRPDNLCYLPANGPVIAAPAEGVNNPAVAFFGDHTGTMFAYLATSSCSPALVTNSAQTQPVVAGPVVLRNPYSGKAAADEIYVVVADSSSSALVHYEFVSGKKSNTLTLIQSQLLPAGQAVGLTFDQQQQLPARAAVTFAGGSVAVVQIQTDFTMSTLSWKAFGLGIADAPAWCCGASPTLIGVAQTHKLYVLDANLNVVSSYGVNTTISGSPVSDRGGDWFFGADDGNVYEVPSITPTPAILSLGSGQLGQVRSSTQIGDCGTQICIYLGSANGNAYVIPLDARDALVTVCVSSAPSCSAPNPGLWANIEVGASGSPQTVHVQGWSYYSA